MVCYKEMEVEPTVHPIFKAGTERSSLQYKRLYGIPVLKGKKQVNGSSSELVTTFSFHADFLRSLAETSSLCLE
jgi:hypothetical protein